MRYAARNGVFVVMNHEDNLWSKTNSSMNLVCFVESKQIHDEDEKQRDNLGV